MLVKLHYANTLNSNDRCSLTLSPVPFLGRIRSKYGIRQTVRISD